MTRFLLLLLPLAAELVLLSFLARKLNAGLYRTLGKFFYLLLLIPGVVIHELSHLAACWLTFTRVTAVRLFDPYEEAPGALILGKVEHARPRTWPASVLIGSAPFFGGSASIYGIVALLTQGQLGTTNDAVSLMTMFGNFLHALDWSQWTTYLALYCMIAIAAHLSPSPHDLKSMGWVLFGLTLLCLALLFVLQQYAPATAERLATWLGRPVATLSAVLGFALIFTVLTEGTLVGLGLLIRRMRQRHAPAEPPLPPSPSSFS